MKRRSDEEISAPLYAFDAEVRSQYGCFAGVDEAGRGPLCGPVCVAACILDPENPVYGINDSKKLTEKKREALFDEICEKALAYRIIFVGPEVIDRENILKSWTSCPIWCWWTATVPPQACRSRHSRWSRAMPPALALARPQCWPRSAETAICWSWTSSIRSISWQSTRATPQSCTTS